MNGPRPTHPFKVIESEPDRRSISSDSRPIHGRQASAARLVNNESMQHRVASRPSDVSVLSSTSDRKMKIVHGFDV